MSSPFEAIFKPQSTPEFLPTVHDRNLVVLRGAALVGDAAWQTPDTAQAAVEQYRGDIAKRLQDVSKVDTATALTNLALSAEVQGQESLNVTEPVAIDEGWLKNLESTATVQPEQN
jgi:hypothetical protein